MVGLGVRGTRNVMIQLTTLQGFEAMTIFLREHSHGSHSLENLLEEMRYYLSSGGEPITNLPGLWEEWLDAVTRATTQP